MTIEIWGVDLGKTTCSIVGLDGAGMAPLKANGGGALSIDGGTSGAHHATDLRLWAEKGYSSGDSRLYKGD